MQGKALYRHAVSIMLTAYELGVTLVKKIQFSSMPIPDPSLWQILPQAAILDFTVPRLMECKSPNAVYIAVPKENCGLQIGAG